MTIAAEEKRVLRAAAVQMESRPGAKEKNFRIIEHFVEEAVRQKVRLLVFPECCVSGYWFLRNLSVPELRALAEPIFDGPSSRRLLELSRASGITIGAGWVEIDASAAFYN